MTKFSEDRLEELPWPLITIDFEASALDPRSYPIEVGICRLQSPASPLENWSTLISPTPDWIKSGFWSMDSEQIHRIPQSSLLRDGVTPTSAIASLNALIGEGVCYCDGGDFDRDWARKLGAASEIKPTFKLGDYSMLLHRLDVIDLHAASMFLNLTPEPHRAGPDAKRLLLIFLKSLNINVENAIQLPQAIC